MFDLVLRGGGVLDGTGSPVRRADVGIASGRITAVGDLAQAEAAAELDVTGVVVAPGFVDAHAHTDLSLFGLADDSDLALAGLRQGVTTEVCGNCGWTPYPRTDKFADAVDRHIGAAFPGATSVVCSYGAFRDAARGLPLGANLAPLVGHGTIRAAAMGLDDRRPDEDELRSMERLTAQAMDEGAFGLSSGLMYPPGVYAGTEEVARLAAVAARYGRVYATHMRDEANHVLESVAEAVCIGARTGVPVQISHHKVAGKRNWGRTAETLAAIERARAEGVDVAVDVYPYTAGSTMLRAMLPPWANDGGVDALLDRLRQPETVRRIERDFTTGLDGWQDLASLAGWSNVIVASAQEKTREGGSVAQLAEAAGTTPVEFVCRLLLEEDGGSLVVIHMMDEADVQAVLAQPWAMVGSDGILVPGKPHPRAAGTFVRVLGRYAVQAKLFDVAEAVRKMTSLPAARFGLHDRGAVAAGKVADLVVFDPATVCDGATYDDPLRPPTGIDYVLVGGQVVIDHGRDTRVRRGAVLEPQPR
jgi:N-acyl-D-aspartate/D-glutamate deacylase